MSHDFNPTTRAHINKDEQGFVRELLHDDPIVSKAATAQQLRKSTLPSTPNCSASSPRN